MLYGQELEDDLELCRKKIMGYKAKLSYYRQYSHKLERENQELLTTLEKLTKLLNKEEFCKDKDKKIAYIALRLGNLCKTPTEKILTTKSVFSQQMNNSQIKELEHLATDLLKQVHELNAGRNIFKDNDDN